MNIELLLCGKHGTVLLGFYSGKLFVSPSVMHIASPGPEESFSYRILEDITAQYFTLNVMLLLIINFPVTVMLGNLTDHITGIKHMKEII
jgi:hypothetical protein